MPRPGKEYLWCSLYAFMRVSLQFCCSVGFISDGTWLNFVFDRRNVVPHQSKQYILKYLFGLLTLIITITCQHAKLLSLLFYTRVSKRKVHKEVYNKIKWSPELHTKKIVIIYNCTSAKNSRSCSAQRLNVLFKLRGQGHKNWHKRRVIQGSIARKYLPILFMKFAQTKNFKNIDILFDFQKKKYKKLWSCFYNFKSSLLKSTLFLQSLERMIVRIVCIK